MSSFKPLSSCTLLVAVTWGLSSACSSDDDGAGGTAGRGGSATGGASAGGSGGSETGGTGMGGSSAGGAGDAGTNGSGDAGSPQQPSEGVCRGTCDKACERDDDCNTSFGELCCSYGDAGSICVQGSVCPRYCASDAACNAGAGETCRPASLSSKPECLGAAAGVHPCGGDGDCSPGELCCTLYDRPICLTASQCPIACNADDDCNAASGETCCTTARLLEPHLSATGLCLNRNYQSCPRACKSGDDCSLGETCCNGVCSTTCEQTCRQSSDCTSPLARLCCVSASARLPPPTQVFTAGPHCAGTAYGCSALGMMSASNCSAAAGCKRAPESCGGTPYDCSYSDSFETQCQGRSGCTYDPETGFCDGTPAACEALETLADCNVNPGCSWITITACSGKAKPCSSFSTATCSTNPGCYLTQER